ncbi:MAG: hypothetical protein ABR562_09265 [Thermoplasmatota archaeon]
MVNGPAQGALPTRATRLPDMPRAGRLLAWGAMAAAAVALVALLPGASATVYGYYAATPRVP